MFERAMARSGPHAGGLERILDRERDSMQWTEGVATLQCAVGLGREGERAIAVQGDDGVESRVVAVDARQMSVDNGHRAELAGADRMGNAYRVEHGRVVHVICHQRVSHGPANGNCGTHRSSHRSPGWFTPGIGRPALQQEDCRTFHVPKATHGNRNCKPPAGFLGLHEPRHAGLLLRVTSGLRCHDVWVVVVDPAVRDERV